MGLVNQLSMYRMFSSDPEKLRAFYENTLELSVERSDENIVIFNTGTCKFGIERSDPGEDLNASCFLGISFDTDDISRAVETLNSRGVTITGEPTKQYWGGTLAHFEDPDENTVTLVEYPRET